MKKLIFADGLARIGINAAIEEAKKATCLRRKCGAVIVNHVLDPKHYIIGRGFNSPPGNLESQRRCLDDKNKYHEKITDKTCCMHAEQRAYFDSLDKYRRRDIANGYSTLYFMAVDEKGESIPAGNPYCTFCSKSALDWGISKWVLQHDSGLYLYGAEEYNDLSYDYGK